MEDGGVFHICTKGFADRLMFKDAEDFVQGVNKAALSFRPDCQILALCLMSNHVHFVARGDFENVKRAFHKFKKTYGMWYSDKYDELKVFKHWPHKIIKCSDTDYMKDVIGYVYRNPVGHSETNNPYYYPWSSVNVHFSKNYGIQSGMDRRVVFGGVQMNFSDLKQWQKRKLFHTQDEVPDNWSVCESGMFSYESFIGNEFVEKLFRTERAFNYFVQKREHREDGASFVDLTMESDAVCCDYNVLKKCKDISYKLFGTCDVESLEEDKKIKVMKALKYHYCTDERMLQRIFGVSV